MDWDNSGTIDITEAGRAIFLLTDPFSVWKEWMSNGDWNLQTWMYDLFDHVELKELIAEGNLDETYGDLLNHDFENPEDDAEFNPENNPEIILMMMENEMW